MPLELWRVPPLAVSTIHSCPQPPFCASASLTSKQPHTPDTWLWLPGLSWREPRHRQTVRALCSLDKLRGRRRSWDESHREKESSCKLNV